MVTTKSDRFSDDECARADQRGRGVIGILGGSRVTAAL
jgi:hypothetical protein